MAFLAVSFLPGLLPQSFGQSTSGTETLVVDMASNTGSVWGGCWTGSHQHYTNDSNWALMARHQLGLSWGARYSITVTYYAGQSSYASCTNNGVTTSSYHSWWGSMRITGWSYVSCLTPGDPSGLTATPTGSTTATLSWTRGANSAHPYIQFDWWLHNNSTTAIVQNGTSSSSSVSVSGLTAGTVYYFRVRTRINAGTCNGTVSSTVQSAPFVTVPPDPTSVSASPATAICSGTSVQLTAHGADGTVYWYSGSCGGTFVGTSNPITVSPTVTTTYFARNYASSTFSAGCASRTVTVNALPSASVSGSATILDNASHTVTGASAANGTIAWSHNGAGSLTAHTTLSPTYNAVATDAGKTVTLTLTVTSTTGCGTATASFPLTIRGTPAMLAILTQPVGGQAGKQLATTPVIQIRDTNDNPLNDASNAVTVAIVSGSGGSLGGTTTVTASGGTASFADLTMGGSTGTGYTLRFSSAGLASVDAGSLNLLPGDPSQIEILHAPATTVAGQWIRSANAEPPTVQLRDAFGNTVAAGHSVSATLSDGAFTNGSQTQVQTNAAGIAAFDTLSVTHADTGYRINFTLLP